VCGSIFFHVNSTCMGAPHGGRMCDGDEASPGLGPLECKSRRSPSPDQIPQPNPNPNLETPALFRLRFNFWPHGP